MKKLVAMAFLFIFAATAFPAYALESPVVPPPSSNEEVEPEPEPMPEPESTASSELPLATPSAYEASSSAYQATSSATLTLSRLGLPDVWILPSSPVYFLKLWIEKIRLFLIFSPEAKVKYLLAASEVRLAEAYKLIDQGAFDRGKNTIDAYEKEVDQIIELLKSMPNQENSVLKYVRKIEANSAKLERILAFFTEKAKTGDSTNWAKEQSLSSLEQAIKVLAQSNIATPSFEIKQRINGIIWGESVSYAVKMRIQKKLTDKIITELQRKVEESTAAASESSSSAASATVEASSSSRPRNLGDL